MNHKTKGSHIVVSLKSSSIELSIVESGKIPEIVFFKKTTLLFKKALTPDEFIKESLLSLRQLLEKEKVNLMKHSSSHPDFHVIVYSPWFLPEITKVEEKNKKVSLKDLIKDKIYDPKEEEYYQIENKITNIIVNGYHLDEIKDIDSNDIEINLFRSYLSKDVAMGIKELISKVLPSVRGINFSSSAMQSFELIKDLFVHEDNCCFVNIGGEVTEFGIIEDDVLVKFSTFPMGKHAFSRELNTFLGEKENLDIINFIGDKNSDFSLNKEGQEKLNSLSNEWVEKIMKIINEFSGENPKKTFVINNSDSINFFKDILEKSPLKDELFFVPIEQDAFETKIKFFDKKATGVEYLVSGHYSQIMN